MRYAVTAAQMKEIDRDTMERIGIPSMVLMERAALALADEAERLLKGDKKKRILAVCGTGNNGADGIAAGRILWGRGYPVTLLLGGDPQKESDGHRRQRQIAEQLGLRMIHQREFLPETGGEAADGALCPESADLVLDALFGIGLDREIGGSWRTLMEELAGLCEKAQVLAADIPSGIHGDTGAVMGMAWKADVTVTFGYEKAGLLLYPGRSYAGRVVIADIGFSEVSLQRAGFAGEILELPDLAMLPERAADGNKGSFGRVLVIAGSRGMSGAAYLSTLAAYRTGAGLCRILTVEENRAILQTQLPEAIVEVYDPESLEAACDWADVIVLGPGLGSEVYVEYLMETVLSHAYVPVVLDADGLNHVASHPYLTRYFTENIIITPHMGEMSRLCGLSIGELKANRRQAAADYSGRYNVVCVLKDASTVICDKDGNTYYNTSGCSAMAKAGSGDVLTGVIAGLLARGMECTKAAAYGVYLHGLAGEQAARERGIHSVLAGDIANCLLKDCREEDREKQ